MAGLVGLVGDVRPKSILPRVLKLFWPCWVLVVEVVLADAVELLRDWGFGSWEVAVVVVVAAVAVEVGDFAIGRDIPRSFPRLATPTPQVKVVR